MAAPADLRTVWCGASAWAGALLGLHLRGATLLLTIGVAAGVVVGVAVAAAVTAAVPSLATPRVGVPLLVVGCLLVAGAMTVAAALRAETTRSGPVAQLATEGAVATVQLSVRSDPLIRPGRFGPVVLVRGRLLEATGRGRSWTGAVPVLVVAGQEWADVRYGAEVVAVVRLAPPERGPEVAVLHGGTPREVGAPSPVHDGAAVVRESVRASSSHGPLAGPPAARPLVPALVTGDDQALDADVVADFRTAGLTHLTAVSGTNLTLVLAALLLVARLCGVRGRWAVVVGLAGTAGFVLLARPEPSVVRAAAMGVVTLLALGSGGRQAGVRALGVAVWLLLASDPWLARSPGFALSVLATGGLLFVAPGVRDALARWLPRWSADAVAVPLAAQLACTPLVAALSGEVSLVAVGANLLVAPVVGPATVLGLLGGVVGLVAPPVGAVAGGAATWCAAWIVWVAARSADLPLPALDWPDSATGLAALTVLSLALALTARWALRRPPLAVATALLLVVVVTRPAWLPGRLWGAGWPPAGWALVACDVGQGDALVVATAPDEALVVDAGPDPRAVDRCLDRLGVRRVPAVLLTHFHADHVDGLPGVLDGRTVGEIAAPPLPEPSEGADRVARWSAEAGVPVRVPAYGEAAATGEASWVVVGPRPPLPTSPNDASLVLLLEVRGVRVLLTGDVEPPGQAELRRAGLGPVDVLKVPHHGSRYQDLALLTGLGARLAVVSAGEDNDYGHPDPDLLAALEAAGMAVRRTDRDGHVAVVPLDDGALGVVTSR